MRLKIDEYQQIIIYFNNAESGNPY